MKIKSGGPRLPKDIKSTRTKSTGKTFELKSRAPVQSSDSTDPDEPREQTLTNALLEVSEEDASEALINFVLDERLASWMSKEAGTHLRAVVQDMLATDPAFKASVERALRRAKASS